MRHLLHALALASLLALPVAAATHAPTVSAVPADVRAWLGAVTRAYGGANALARVHAYRLEGTIFSAMRHTQAGTVRVWALPGRFKVLVNYDQAPEARVVNGDRVWRNEAGGPLETASGPMRAAVLLQAGRAGVPWTLIAHAADARVLADEPPPAGVLERVDGSPTRLVCLEVTIDDGLHLRAWADSLGRVVVSQGLLDSGPMRTHFETVYSDFRDTSGVLFAYKELNYASGMRTGITTATHVTIDPELRTDEFTPADAGDGFAPPREGR
jgi:hypothetical protein